MAFAFFECRPGTWCRIRAIPGGRDRVDRKLDGEWIRSGKGHMQKQGRDNKIDQELETCFWSHAEEQSTNPEWKKVVITGRKECGEQQELGPHNLISRSQREGMRTEGNGDGRAVAHSAFKNLIINVFVLCFCFLTNCWDTLAQVNVSIAL